MALAIAAKARVPSCALTCARRDRGFADLHIAQCGNALAQIGGGLVCLRQAGAEVLAFAMVDDQQGHIAQRLAFLLVQHRIGQCGRVSRPL